MTTSATSYNHDPAAVREKIKQLRDLRYTQETEGFGHLSDDLSQSDDFKTLCLELADEAVEREAMAEAIESRIKDLQARKQRIQLSAQSIRDIVLQCMDIRSEKTITSPALTLSVSHRSGDLVITDESAIPSDYFIPQPPKLDKKALKEAVCEHGEVIEGTSRGNGKISLTIRRK